MTRAAALVFALLCVGPGAVRAQAGALQARFDTLIQKGLEQDPLPGIAVGIVRHGRVVYARGFGVMRLGHPDEPVTPRTLFHMASITKTFVATAVMQLWEQGRVDLDAPVVRYVRPVTAYPYNREHGPSSDLMCRKPGAWVGISWFIETKDGHPLISHSGGDDGFMTDLVLARDADMGLVLMTNALAAGTTLPREIVRAFYDVVKESYGGPP